MFFLQIQRRDDVRMDEGTFELARSSAFVRGTRLIVMSRDELFPARQNIFALEQANCQVNH